METLTAPSTTEYDLSDVDIARDDIPIEERNDVTVDELERLSLPYPAELYNGKVVYKIANFDHALIQSNVHGAIFIYLKSRPIGYVVDEANFRLWNDRPKESRIPDVAFVAKERAPKDKHRFLAMAPDLAVEIVSEDDSYNKIMAKVKAYLQQGAKIVWVIFASTREVLVCTAEGKHYVDEVLTAPEVLPDFALPVQDIFEGFEN